MKKNLAFTLAEVLITLAIIGVVAAMTIPTLVNKYQDRVNETRYKKAVSMLSQAVQLSMAQADSPGNMTHTDLWNCKAKDDVQACYKDATKRLFKSIALDGEALIDKMADIDYGETTNPWDNVDYAFTTGDGITFGYASSDEGLRLILDTNVASKPNNISKDLYALQILPNGKVTDITTSLTEEGNLNCESLLNEDADFDTVMAARAAYEACIETKRQECESREPHGSCYTATNGWEWNINTKECFYNNRNAEEPCE